jgi:hypothetical protein
MRVDLAEIELSDKEEDDGSDGREVPESVFYLFEINCNRMIF